MDVPSAEHPGAASWPQRRSGALGWVRVSVQRYDTADGVRWRVRWREHGGRMRSRSVTSKREALALDADLRARKFKGEALPRPARETLAAAYDEWWRLRGSTLAPATQATYRAVWSAHVGNRFDHHRLDLLVAEPQLFEEFIADMRDRGVGPAAQRKTLVVISAVLTACVEWRKIATNPLLHVRKPPGTRQRVPRPFPPVVVERIRLRMLRRATKQPSWLPNTTDALLVSLMSYAGLRPSEALALRFGDIGVRTIVVDKAVSDGVVGPTKTGTVRSVPLLGMLRTEIADARQLQSFRTAGGREPGDDDLLFPAEDGRPWSRSHFNNWRGRVWKAAVRALAADERLAWLAAARPYDCRGSFVSLHLRAGASPLEVAAWAGHSPQVMFKHYANVIDELVGEPVLPAEDQIARARAVVESAGGEHLNNLVVDLLENPTLGSQGSGGAAQIFYAPRAGE